MDAIHQIRSRLDIQKNARRFPKKSTLYSILSSAANKQIPIHQVIEEEYPQFIPFIGIIEDLSRNYKQHKEKNYVIYFDDLLVKCRDLLQNHPYMRKQVSDSHLHVI